MFNKKPELCPFTYSPSDFQEPFDSRKVMVESDMYEFLDSLTKRMRRPQPVLTLSVPACGADGVTLKVVSSYSPFHYADKTREVSLHTALHALLDHLGVELYVDESVEHHPVKVRKAKR